MPHDNESTANDEVLGHSLGVYGGAVLHVLVSVADKRWTLLFAFVELLPLEVPAPLHDGFVAGPVLKKTNARIFAHHVPLSAGRALEWYKDAREGRVVRPELDGSLPAPEGAGVTLCEPLDWTPEPAWPEFVLISPPRRMPFLSRWHHTPRVSHLVPSIDRWRFESSEMDALDEFVEQQFGFRHAGWPQLAGSIHLVAPNPYFRSLDQRTRINDAGQEVIEAAIEPRAHVQLPSLQLHVIEHRPTGIGASKTISVDAQPRAALASRKFHAVSAHVDMAAGGALYVLEHGHILRDFHLNMDVGSTMRRVGVEDGKGNVVEPYEVRVMQPFAHRSANASPPEATGVLAVMVDEVEIQLLPIASNNDGLPGTPPPQSSLSAIGSVARGIRS